MASQESYPPVFQHLKPSLADSTAATCEEYLGGLGVMVHNALTSDECKAVIDASEKFGYQDAKEYCFMYFNRQNDRFMSDDPELASFLWKRVQQFVPKRVEAFDRKWEVDDLNIRFRFCKYIGGQGHYFGPHCDGVYSVDKDHMSLLTCMFYLNGTDDFEGGRTNFIDHQTHKLNYSVKPEPGLCVIFRQRDLRCYHEGTEVTKGLKYIMRTDIMYHAVD